ncbi:MAG: asparagine synthase (glutamine-hydrolyzing) [Flavobacteriales bacterium]|nr:asparagine synthase (glutamine-hydrolyzing) [Flavobacteriales bacterium]
MCGINGIWNSPTPADDAAAIAIMNRTLAHRGPDADGQWSGDKIALGHRRLSIIDTSAAGNQPMHSADGRWHMVFNGELYNYIELKSELPSAHFQTSSDTEVVLAAWQQWGPASLQKMTGMFAFALWDEQEKRLFVVRDRLGVKPLYYAQPGDSLVFSSEIRALLSSGRIKKKISAHALHEYLQYATVHAPGTLIEGVSMLLPGHFLQCDASGIQSVRYWTPTENRNNAATRMSPEDVRRQIRDLMQRSVEIRMRADVPFGAFLSGGIDSSAITGLMASVSSHPVRTFSVTFDEKDFDESTYAALIAKRFNTDHTRIHVRASDFLKLIPDALQAMDHPSGDGPNTYVVSKVTREAGVKMALSGIGGDELFCGYPVFTQIRELENKKWLRMTPKSVRSLMGSALAALKPSVAAEKIKATLRQTDLDFAHIYPLKRRVLDDDQVGRLMPNFTTEKNEVVRITNEISSTWLPLLSKVSVVEINTYMQNVLLRDTDQMSMAHSLEVREPFLDHHLVEFVLGIGDDLKYPHTPKQLLTQSLGDLLPREIIDRPKMGFTFPWSHWMKNEMRSWCEAQLLLLKGIETLDHSAVMRLWNNFLAGDKRITWSRIWPLVVLGNWISRHDVH